MEVVEHPVDRSLRNEVNSKASSILFSDTGQRRPGSGHASARLVETGHLCCFPECRKSLCDHRDSERSTAHYICRTRIVFPVSCPWRLPPCKSLLRQPLKGTFHEHTSVLGLLAWRLSMISSLVYYSPTLDNEALGVDTLVQDW